MSYAEVASKGAKQTPEEAAAPQPPQVQVDVGTASSTGSLIDVDTPSVHTVPSDFESQEIQTETQAARVEREEEQEAARAEAAAADKKKKRVAEEAAAKKRRAEGWLARHLDGMKAGGAGAAVSIANIVAVVGLSGFLGFKAWGLYDRGRLGWKEASLGLGVLSAVGVVEGVFLNYFSKAKGKDH